MSKIFILMGKSASGKDTLYQMLLADQTLQLKQVVPYTTRPIRSGETQGREYHFVEETELIKFQQANKVIEHRAYKTIHGLWHYFTADDGQINLSGNQHYLMIDTLAGYIQLVQYFGVAQVVPLYIEVEDGLRLFRALERERTQKEPKYAELCRRFLADSEDFSEENLAAAGIKKHFINAELTQCFQELANVISQIS